MTGDTFVSAPFSGHLYYIPTSRERLDFIVRIHDFGLVEPDGPQSRSGKREMGDRIMDMGGGWVLTTLSPERLKVLFPNIADMRPKQIGRAA
jgi:hypothetical protein